MMMRQGHSVRSVCNEWFSLWSVSSLFDCVNQTKKQTERDWERSHQIRHQIKLNFFLSKRIDSFDHYHHHEFRDVNKNKNDNKKLDEEEEILENWIFFFYWIKNELEKNASGFSSQVKVFKQLDTHVVYTRKWSGYIHVSRILKNPDNHIDIFLHSGFVISICHHHHR